MDDLSWLLFFIGALIYTWVIDRRQRKDAERAEERFELLQKDFAALEQRVKAALAASPAEIAAPAPEVHIATEPPPKPAAAYTAPAHAPLVAAKPATPAAPEVHILSDAPAKPAAAHTAPAHAPFVAAKPATPAAPEKPAASIASPPPVHALCKRCARELIAGADFCTFCGARVTAETPSVKSAEAPAAVSPKTVAAAAASAQSQSVPAPVSPTTAKPAAPAIPPPPPMPAPAARSTAAAAASPTTSAPTTQPAIPVVAASPSAAAKTTFSTGGPIFSSAAPAAPKKRSWSFEKLVGTKLLPRIGAVLLVVGVAFLTATQWDHVASFWRLITAWGRAAVVLLGGMALLLNGIRFERNARYKTLGRSMIGGGWAIIFLLSYAIRHAPAFQILPSDWVDLAVLLVVAGAMVWHTLKYNSQTVTGLAFLLGFTAVALNHDPPFSLLAGAILVAGMTVIVVRRQWFELEVFGILASYANHFYWLFQVYEQQGERVKFPHHSASVALVIGYWSIFRVSYLVRKISSQEQESVSTFAALLNPILFLAVMKYQGFHPDWTWWVLLAMGSIEFCLGQLPVSRRRRTPFLALSSLGAALMVASVPFKYSGNSLELVWLAGAEAFLLAGILTRERLFRWFGLITSFLVALYALPLRILPLAQQIANGQTHHYPQISLLLAVIAVALYANAHITRGRWPSLFENEIEQFSLTVLSFLASVFAVGAVYAYVPEHATAAALALLVAWLSGAGQRFRIAEMIYEAHWVAAVACIQVMASDSSLEAAWLHIPQRGLSFASVAALLYLSSRFVRLSDTNYKAWFAGGYAWAGTTLLTLLILFQATNWAVAVLWVILGVALSLVGQTLKRTDLKWQAFGLVLLSFVRAFAVNFEITTAFHQVTYRLISVSMLAAGIYLLTRWAPMQRLRPVYTGIGTVLLTYLIFTEAAPAWTAVTWVALALALSGAALFFKQEDLKWQAFALVLLSSGRTLQTNFDLTATYHSLTLRLISVSLTALGIYLLTRWAPMKQLRPLYTGIGTALLTYLIFREAALPWTAVIWIALAVALTAAALMFKQEDLKWHTFALVLLSLGRTVQVNFDVSGDFHHLSYRLISVSLTALGIYLLTRWAPMKQLRPLYTGIGTALLTYLIFREAALPWTAVIWIALAMALTAAGLKFKQADLKWHTFALVLLSLGRTFQVNFDASGDFHHLSYRLISVSLTALGIYLLARWAPLQQLRPFYSAAGTLLLTWLAFKESPAPWTPVFWIGLALALALAARWWKDRPLLWQTHLLAGLAAGWTLYLFYDPQYRATHVQLITVTLTAVVLYALTWLTNIGTVIEDERMCQAYPWAASLLISWLAWYQLPTNSVALAWGMFGLLLFEFPDIAGSLKIGITPWAALNWRAQAYVALAGSFVRIFIANINTISWSSTFLVVCLAAIYFFIYWEMGRRDLSRLEKSIYLEFWPGWLGTASLAALARFELPADAVVIGYAGLVVSALLAAWLAHRQTFLFQALVLLGITAFRISMSNFFHLHEQFGSSLSSAIWAIALLASAVPVAFQARKNTLPANMPGWLRAVALRPEQPVFFVCVTLLTVLLFLKLSAGRITLAWGVEGIVVFILALWAKERSFRLTGLGLVLLATGKIFLWDAWQVNDSRKWLALIAVGAIAMAVPYLYGRNREALRDYL